MHNAIFKSSFTLFPPINYPLQIIVANATNKTKVIKALITPAITSGDILCNLTLYFIISPFYILLLLSGIPSDTNII